MSQHQLTYLEFITQRGYQNFLSIARLKSRTFLEGYTDYKDYKKVNPALFITRGRGFGGYREHKKVKRSPFMDFISLLALHRSS